MLFDENKKSLAILAIFAILTRVPIIVLYTINSPDNSLHFLFDRVY